MSWLIMGLWRLRRLTTCWRLSKADGVSNPSPKARDPGEPMVSISVWEQETKVPAQTSRHRANSLFLHLFVLFTRSADWMDDGRTGEGSLLHSVYSNTNLFLEHPHRRTPKQCLTSYLGSWWSSQVNTQLTITSTPLINPTNTCWVSARCQMLCVQR